MLHSLQSLAFCAVCKTSRRSGVSHCRGWDADCAVTNPQFPIWMILESGHFVRRRAEWRRTSTNTQSSHVYPEQGIFQARFSLASVFVRCRRKRVVSRFITVQVSSCVEQKLSCVVFLQVFTTEINFANSKITYLYTSHSPLWYMNWMKVLLPNLQIINWTVTFVGSTHCPKKGEMDLFDGRGCLSTDYDL